MKQIALFSFIVVLLSLSPVTAQESVITGEPISIGNYVIVYQRLSDSTTEACIGVYPIVDSAEASLYCSIDLLGVDNLEQASNGTDVGSFTSYNIKADRPGFDTHCLVSIPKVVGPEPKVNCSL